MEWIPLCSFLKDVESESGRYKRDDIIVEQFELLSIVQCRLCPEIVYTNCFLVIKDKDTSKCTGADEDLVIIHKCILYSFEKIYPFIHFNPFIYTTVKNMVKSQFLRC